MTTAVIRIPDELGLEAIMFVGSILSAVSVPIIVAIVAVLGSILGWYLKTRRDELCALEERLENERRRRYVYLIQPYIRIVRHLFFARRGDSESRKVLEKDITFFNSDQHIDSMTHIMLYGSDEVISNYCSFLASLELVVEKELAAGESASDNESDKLVKDLCNLLLDIRTSLMREETETSSGKFEEIIKSMGIEEAVELDTEEKGGDTDLDSPSPKRKPDGSVVSSAKTSK